MTKALRKQMLLLLTIMALVITGYAPSTTYASEAHVDNPFVGATAYVNPDYAALIDTSIAQVTDSTLVSKMETIKNIRQPYGWIELLQFMAERTMEVEKVWNRL